MHKKNKSKIFQTRSKAGAKTNRFYDCAFHDELWQNNKLRDSIGAEGQTAKSAFSCRITRKILFTDKLGSKFDFYQPQI